MSDSNFELPQAAEKLSYKFIFDALQKDSAAVVSSSFEVNEVGELNELVGESPETGADAIQMQVQLSDDEAPAEGEPIPQPMRPLDLPPGKKYFRIGEVSECLGVEAYVLRYWENEFPSVHPMKTKNGHRVYARKEVELLHLIEHLLHVEKFSIKGARKQIQERRRKLKAHPDGAAVKNHQLLKDLAHQLKELIHIARGNPGF